YSYTEGVAGPLENVKLLGVLVPLASPKSEIESLLTHCPDALKVTATFAMLTAVSFGMSQAVAEQIDLFIMAGQSNMVGSARLDVLPAGHPHEYPEILYTHDSDGLTDDWGPLQARLRNNLIERRWFGPEFTFGRRMVELGIENVGIIKYGRSGSSLSTKWSPDSDLRNDFYAFVDQALASLTDDGHTYRLAGFVWVQGSGDAQVLESAQEYDENLGQFIGEIEGRYGETTTVLNRYHIDSSRPYVSELRTSQSELGDVDPSVYLIHTDDLDLRTDNIHFTHDTHLEVGERLADTYLRSLRLPGDFNSDGVVNTADYTVWRNALGSISALDSDSDGDGVIETDDYLKWLDTFGQVESASLIGSAIPEPHALALLLLAVLMVLSGKRLIAG
ncbi:MAG: sialate O-acetylesterase, partial [Aeoliella sp.]